MKKRILWVGEFTEMNTGFSVYGKELLKRLHATKKYEIFELAAYCSKNDPRIKNIPWVIIPNAPNSPEEAQEYNKNIQNQWGMWRFEDALLKVKPDVVLSIRDPWHDSFITCSPFRDKYFFIHMPTVDSAPLQESWLAAYIDANAILTYSEFGRDTLIKETGGKIKFKGVASSGVDYNIFKPVKDKKEHKKRMGLQENVLIVGTVMRNQKRKLFQELFNAFHDFIEKYPHVGKNTYLYCHTQYPDVGWDIPRLIKESGISHKVLFSYICSNCLYYFPSFFRDAISFCPRCRQLTVKMPGVGLGFTSEQLADVYNLFDLYVQYSITEGLGIPQIEAASCAVPITSVNYSAMESVVKNLSGIPINVAVLFRECETHAYRAYPDNADFVKKMYGFLSKPENIRLQKGYETYLLCRKFYDYDKVATLWSSIIDEAPYSEKWTIPKHLISPNFNVPNDLSNEQFVYWCKDNILKHAPLNDYFLLQIIRDLNYGQSTNRHIGIFHSEDSALGGFPKNELYNRERALNEFKEIVNKFNYWENKR